MRRVILLLALLFWPAPTFAEDPPIPQPRPPAATDSGAGFPLPRERPPAAAVTPAASQPAATASPATPGTGPPAAAPAAEPPAPPRDYQTACPAVLEGQVEATPLPPISDRQCGLRSPLSVTAVMANGRLIPFSSPATIDCGLATALPQWAADVDSYAQSHDRTTVERIGISTSYMCRNVDNQESGNLSFHAFGDALDVIGLTLGDGRNLTIAGTWNATPKDGRDIIRYAHDAACSRFTTVLGPDADAFHQDNLHLDLGCHGKSCTYRICQ